MEVKLKTCKFCGKELEGRSDKVYCDAHCKSSYHYKRSIEETPRFYNRVDNQLKLNRRILKSFNKAGKTTVRANVLLEQGFNPKYFTHYWKNTKGDIYFFVYEYGFLKKAEKGRDKYVLVQWQDYMDK
ncbi:hypothetical protein EYD45_13880 [Hyunsoonleella flava]|uniref:DUF2116 family Zn-ribbon domain-containing protein n=1 Tax=Hyunsoonleella flava TaxID=2527939 RepID=A0A4Q9FB99_9FLAO|nr:hypothetical protein [Hyunsoonleella flava]TBN00909.1 hypothetical protein EYD45_13880 [Hyunsoonleella flava]